MTSNRYEIDDEIYITNLLTNEDIPALIKHVNNPKLYAATLNIPFPYTQIHAEDFIKKINAKEADKSRFFSIRLNSTNEMIGVCGFDSLDYNKRRIGIGYWIAEPYWHRGIVTKVVQKGIEIIKNEWKDFARIEAHIFPWNTGSIRVVEKCGFTYEGLLRKRVYKNGQDLDVQSYAFINE